MSRKSITPHLELWERILPSLGLERFNNLVLQLLGVELHAIQGYRVVWLSCLVGITWG